MMGTDYLGSVQQFHRIFDCYRNQSPLMIPDEKALQRLRLIQEELTELTQAMAGRDLIYVADSLADLLYVVFGTAVAYGLPMDKIFKQVHKSNMTKIGGHHDNTGKFVKPESYQRVDLSWLLESL